MQKLESLLSAGQAESLVRQVYCQSENKCSNEEIYYIIDNLHQAICDGCKVKFAYKRRAVDPKNKKDLPRENLYRVALCADLEGRSLLFGFVITKNMTI